MLLLNPFMRKKLLKKIAICYSFPLEEPSHVIPLQQVTQMLASRYLYVFKDKTSECRHNKHVFFTLGDDFILFIELVNLRERKCTCLSAG